MILNDINDKEPNDGHKVLAELEKMNLLHGLITQNIDSLHAKAGSKKIYEVHGEVKHVHCMKCYTSYDFEVMKRKVSEGQIPPICDKCGGIIRPNVVMFGDSMPRDFDLALKEIEDTELLIIVGSSLNVSPVNYLPRYAKKIVIINNTRTPLDDRAELVIRQGAGKGLLKLLNEVKSLL